jgi:hypothetical protein
MAVAAAKSIGCDICGVDLLINHKGPVVIEVNISPGLQGVTKYTGIDVADKIAKYLYEKTIERKDSSHLEKAEKIMSSIEQVDKPQDHIITQLDFRGSRVLLPELVTKLAQLKEEVDYEFETKKGELYIRKFSLS